MTAAAVDTLHNQLLNKVNQQMGLLQKKVQEQKNAEEQERLRKIQAEMERERKRKEEEERKLREDEENRKKKAEMEARRKKEEEERKKQVWKDKDIIKMFLLGSFIFIFESSVTIKRMAKLLDNFQ